MPQEYDQDGNPINRDNPYNAGNDPSSPGYVQGGQGSDWLAQAQRAQQARVKLTPEQLAAQEAARIEAERAALIGDLRRIAEGGGQAYGTTMKQVGQGNARISALAAGGKGGLNARLNASNAKATNVSAGHQQALQNKAAEISQARSALGQVIAAGQDSSVQQGQDMLAALKANYSNVQPSQAQRYVGMAGQVGQAAWSAYGQNESGGGSGPSQNDRNRTRSGW